MFHLSSDTVVCVQIPYISNCSNSSHFLALLSSAVDVYTCLLWSTCNIYNMMWKYLLSTGGYIHLPTLLFIACLHTWQDCISALEGFFIPNLLNCNLEFSYAKNFSYHLVLYLLYPPTPVEEIERAHPAGPWLTTILLLQPPESWIIGLNHMFGDWFL